jgi:large subunit ribosomal protein L21
MYAVFRSGGKQYRASKGERLRLERLAAEEGASVTFDEVLLLGEGSDIKVGSPLVAGSTVSATVVKQGKSRKVSVVKFKRRQNYLRQGSHRQFFTEVEITGIGEGSKASAASEATADKPAAEKAPVKKPAAAKKTAKKAAAKTASSAEPAKKKVAKKKTAAKKASKKKTS